MVVLLALSVIACGGGGDDGDDGPDASPTATDGGLSDAGVSPDATQACLLTPEIIECTVGNDTPCQAVCAESYCHQFNMLGGSVCTRDCAGVADCPDGWSCNMRGLCRPPG